MRPEAWERAVGPRIARRAEPVRLERGVLHVRVATAPWANELSLLAEEILTQIRAQGVEASGLRFSVGTVAPPPGGEAQAPTPPPSAAAEIDPPALLPPELRAELEAVRDPALRAALAAAALRTLRQSS
jgi:hypothetical protein